MPPDQDPTQNAEALGDKKTLGNQADTTGGGKEPPEGEGGKTYDQVYVDRLKQQLEGEKQELTRISTERDTYRSNAELLSQANSVPTAVPAPAVTPQWNSETFLTAEESSAQAKAFEDLDHKEITKYQLLSTQRQGDAREAKFLTSLGTAATQAQSVSAVNADLGAAPEFNDQAIRQKLLLETQAAMQDPTQTGKYATGVITIDGKGYNPHILMDKLKDHRIAHGAAVKEEKGKIAPESHDAMGGEGPSSAHPSAGSDTFDAAEHLTASERSGAVKGMTLQGFPTSGLTDNEEAYKKIWGGLNEEVKAYRLKHGAPLQSPEQTSGMTQATIWKAK